MKRYEKYKPSGVEWIGEIPEHWDVKKLKYKVHYEKGKNPRELTFDEKGKVYLTMDYLRGNPKQIYYVEDFKNYVNVEENQILLLWDGSNAGEFIRSKAGVLSSTMAILNLYNNNLIYAWHLLKTFERKLKENTIGMGIPHVNSDDFNNQPYLIPPSEEQTSIANYLDEKTAQIDALIEKKQKLIELLKEERTAIINYAVTKGVDPKVKLKPSGIEWLGDIPEHWEVKKLKYVAEINSTRKNYKWEKTDIDEVIFLPMEKVSENGIIDQSNKKPINEISSGFTYFEKDDVIVAKITPCFENGKGALLNDLETAFGYGSTEFHVLRGGNSVVKKFLYYITKTDRFMRLGEAFMTGSAGQKRVPANFVSDFLVGLPSIDEQTAIVKHIEYHTIRIDTAISKINKEINLLREYRTALISEVVTGKIKVA